MAAIIAMINSLLRMCRSAQFWIAHARLSCLAIVVHYANAQSNARCFRNSGVRISVTNGVVTVQTGADGERHSRQSRAQRASVATTTAWTGCDVMTPRRAVLHFTARMDGCCCLWQLSLLPSSFLWLFLSRDGPHRLSQ